MAEQFPLRVADSLARKGHDLAVQRDQYYRELYASGRWRHYGTEAEIKAILTDAAAALEQWQEMLVHGDETQETAPEQKTRKKYYK